MSRQASIWLFFVIVAVGLALSWGQVGRKTQRVFQSEPVVLLDTESPCLPLAAPCAATAGDRALVIGPDHGGLALQQAGMDPDTIVQVEVSALSEDGAVLSTGIATVTGKAWSLPAWPPDTAMLRVRLVGSGEATIADFPVRAESQVNR